MSSDDTIRREFFEARGEFDLPSLSEIDQIDSVETASETIDETRFDTEDDHLASYGIELVRRKGGPDPGWHLVLVDDDGPIEVTFDSRATTAPREASAMLYAVRGGKRLAPTARVSVDRDEHKLFDGAGEPVGLVRDQRHTAHDLRGEQSFEQWSVITVESNGFAADGLHKRLTKSVRSQGAVRASHPRHRPRSWSAPPRTAHKRLAGLVDDYAQVQLANLALADFGLRRGDDTVHEARLAIRRLRTALEVFAEIFDGDWAQHLQGELDWFADALGRVRDVDVAASRASSPSRPNEFATDVTYAELDRIWAESRNAAVEVLESVLASRRYQALVRELDVWRADPPYTKAGDKARKSARVQIQAARKDLDKKLRKATRPDADDDSMHKARRAAKRLRYAAELATPVLDKPAKIRKDAKYLQRALGDLQDSRIAVDYLLEAASKQGEPNTSFTLGWLVAQEQLLADQIRTVLRHSLR